MNIGEPGTYDLIIRQGATFSIKFIWRQPNKPDGSPGDPIDISDYTGKFLLGDLVEWDADIPVGTDGVVIVTIPKEQTELFDFGAVRYTLRLTAPDGSASDLMKGSASLERPTD